MTRTPCSPQSTAAGLTPANINTAGQIVAGGTLEQLAEFAANPPAGARLRPLRVAGAFHTEHMAPAVDALAAAAAGTAVKDPAITLLSNRDGAVVTSGSDWVERIVSQVAYPVRWDRCMATMARLGVTAFIELLPGGTLAGMAKRALPGVELLAIKAPDQLDAARALVAAHEAAGHNGLEPEGGLIVIGSKILGFGGYQPDKVVTNDDLAKIVDTNDEWIRARAGIQSRRVARDDETVADMAEAAGAKALAASGLEPVRGRPGHRRDLLARVAAAQRGGHRRRPARHPRARGLRPQRGLRRVLLRGRAPRPTRCAPGPRGTCS